MSSPLPAVWKALADPSRRHILDALRARPRTTGELCGLFPKVSRFAVMKHLGVLTRARLIVVRRLGRTRWNHLNAVPIQQVYERWVRPYAAHWAGNLTRLKDHLEQPNQGEPMPRTHQTAMTAGVAQVELEIPIKAKPERVWKALVAETGRWWLKDFFTGPAKDFVIEPRLGGRVFEDWGDGKGLVWYTVLGYDPPRSLLLQGFLTPAFGGPAATLLQITLKGNTKGTLVQVSDAIFGNVGEGKVTQTREGWQMLFDGLRAYVEAG